MVTSTLNLQTRVHRRPTEMRSLKILVVDDEASMRLTTKAMLLDYGAEVTTAMNGIHAIAEFEANRPDLILMDLQMPEMNGLEATKRIKEICGEAFVPVIFLTGTEDNEVLKDCLKSGGDDFLLKPVHPNQLAIKIKAMRRIQRLNEQIMAQKAAAEEHSDRIRKEMAIAEALFQRLSSRGCLDHPALKSRLSPVGCFNGDLLLAHDTPQGGLRVLLGDFTGHGLPAAIGALPLADVFHAMTSNGNSVSNMVVEMNRKLEAVLPANLFCAAAVIELDPARNLIEVWNGGLPDILVLGQQGETKEILSSQHLALGICPAKDGYGTVKRLEFDPDLSLVICSDGVMEAQDNAKREFGSSSIQDAMSQKCSSESALEALERALADHTKDCEILDDVSMAEVSCREMKRVFEDECARKECGQGVNTIVPTPWEQRFALSAEALKVHDPIPLIVRSLMELGIPIKNRAPIYTILTELFVNSLDHGLLKLDSKLRSGPDGVEQFYLLREERLAALESGSIVLSVTHQPMGQGGEVRISVEDSGAGFDWEKLSVQPDDRALAALHGRGLQLVRDLCESLEFSQGGRKVLANYRWI